MNNQMDETNFKLDFNRNYFVRNDDVAFKIAVMWTRYSKINLEVQESLFFSNKEIIKDKINYLTYTDIYNELMDITHQWLSDLDHLNDEFDYEVHRTELLTRFSLYKPIDCQKIVELLKSKNHIQEANSIKNTVTMWNNATYWASNAGYEKDNNESIWELWKNLVRYKNGQLDHIVGDKKHIKCLDKMLKNRIHDSFFRTYQVEITEGGIAYADKIKSDFSTIFFKEQLDKDMNQKTFLNKVKNRLKI